MADPLLSQTDTKCCSICGERKPATLAFFVKNGSGLNAACRICHNRRMRDWRRKRRNDPRARRCSTRGCDNPAVYKTHCSAHYQRLLALGSDEPDRPIRKTERRLNHACKIDGCERRAYRRDLCNGHYLRWRRHGDPLAGKQLRAHGLRRLTAEGYVLIQAKDHPAAIGGRVFEHRLVMERILGRPLLPGETVHHKNGVRHENEPENLELWVSRQPAGQRPEDLVAWAEEILARYPAAILAKLSSSESSSRGTGS